jgi:uncharacterized OsmC-like protein/pimeloyl-ACP methyl ester carboxylesterase
MDGETRKTEFTSLSGEKLAAALELPRGRPRGFALFAHCFTCSKDIKAAREIARALRARGIAVLRFDFTGLGGSEGDFANTNFSSNVDDLVSAADFLRDEFAAPALLIGHSLGGAAAIVAAAKIPEIKAVVVIGAPAQADHVVMQISESHEEIRRQGFARVSLAGRPFTIKTQFLDDLSGQNVLNAAAALKKPLLVMHAPHDQTVGIDNATKIFAAAKHPKSFISLDTADHLLSKAGDARYAASVLAAWAERYLDEVPAIEPAPEFKGGAAAQSIDGAPLAVALSIDGYGLVSDGETEDGGSGLGPNPTRIAEAALAACAAMTVRMYARRKQWDLKSIEVCVKRGGSADAHRPRLLEKELRVSGDLDAAQRARLLEIADKCPVHRMLTEGVEVQSRLA